MIECIPQMTMQNNWMASNHKKRGAPASLSARNTGAKIGID
jgi:hypothetical protein